MKKPLTIAAAACAALMIGTTAASADSSVQPADSRTALVNESVAAVPAGPSFTQIGVNSAAASSLGAAPMGATAACALAMGKPWKENLAASGRSDHARGTYKTVNRCAGYGFTAALQYHRWHGWSGLSKKTWTGNKSGTLSWRCQGQGNHKYRVEGTLRGGNDGTGAPRVGRGHGPERRFSC